MGFSGTCKVMSQRKEVSETCPDRNKYLQSLQSLQGFPGFADELLYTAPIFHYNGKPVYRAEQLEKLKLGAEGQDQTDRMIHRLNDPSLTAEVHRFHVMAQELERLEEAIAESEDRWGELAGMHCKTIRQLEMADTLARIQDQDEGLVDDVLKEDKQCGHRA